jgi:hypothetical protein
MRKNKKIKKNLRKYLSFSLLLALIGIFFMPNTAYLTDISKDSIIEISNRERLMNALDPLKENSLLNQAARAKAEAIFKNQTFKHEIDNKKFSYWIKEVGYGYHYIGENLAIDFITAEGVVKAWMGSKTHKENLMNEIFTEIGVSVLESDFHGKKTILVVQVFGSPAKEAPVSRILAMNIKKDQVPMLYFDSEMPMGMESSFLHSSPSGSTADIGGEYRQSYMPPAPFELSAGILMNDMMEYPEKRLLMIFVLLALISLLNMKEKFKFGANVKIIAKKTKSSKPTPV